MVLRRVYELIYICGDIAHTMCEKKDVYESCTATAAAAGISLDRVDVGALARLVPLDHSDTVHQLYPPEVPDSLSLS